MSIEIKVIEKIQGNDISQIRLKNKNGVIASFLTLGATWQEFLIPKGENDLKNLIIGFEKPSEYTKNSLCAGQTIGRVAGRIGNARARIGEYIYKLPKNNNGNCLHGGPNGFHAQNWDYKVEEGSNFTRVIFSYRATSEIDGFPGDMTVQAIMTLYDNNQLSMIFKGFDATETTLFNPTSHPYFNLSNSNNLLTHQLQINSEHVLEVNEELIPSGKLKPVEGTPYDFREGKNLGSAIQKNNGFDDTFVRILGSDNKLLMLTDEESGDRISVYSNRQGIVIYTMNTLEKGIYFARDRGLEGKLQEAVAIEAQDLPDAVNHKNFNQVFLSPGEEKSYEIIFAYENVK